MLPKQIKVTNYIDDTAPNKPKMCISKNYLKGLHYILFKRSFDDFSDETIKHTLNPSMSNSILAFA